MRNLLWVWLMFPLIAPAQQVYWVTFSHKDSTFSINEPHRFLSERAIQRRSKMGISLSSVDLPVAPQFLETLQTNGFKIAGKSKWLNGAAVVARNKEALKSFPFIQSVLLLGSYKAPRNTKMQDAVQSDTGSRFGKIGTNDSSGYGVSYKQLQQINLPVYHKNFSGEGVWIAVLDAGFYKARQHPAFQSLFQSGRVLATHDFVTGDSNVFNDDDHGLAVLSCLAANQQGVYKGSAPDAGYILLRCEDADSEMPIEEVFWAEAAEFADSMGVDLINSSLGYNEFDEPWLNHTRKELNGHSTLISQAASIAVSTGMTVVNSAGNEGDGDWRYIAVPADVSSVITVGGVDAKGHYVAFSSVGTGAKKDIKPDVVALADNVWVASPSGSYYQGDGTSYAGPIMSGAVACLMQQYPNTTPGKLQLALHQSGNQYYKSDQYVGYGIPDMVLASGILGAGLLTTDTLMDVRRLKDRKLHILFVSGTEQKLNITVSKPDGTVLLTESAAVKKGANRLPLHKSRKLASGNYKVICKSSLTLSQEVDIMLP